MNRKHRNYLPQRETRGRLPDAAFPDVDPNHHLWRNGRLWWVAMTVHLPDWTARRVRRSLGTDDIHEARRRRDRLFEQARAVPGVSLSLRYARIGA